MCLLGNRDWAQRRRRSLAHDKALALAPTEIATKSPYPGGLGLLLEGSKNGSLAHAGRFGPDMAFITLPLVLLVIPQFIGRRKVEEVEEDHSIDNEGTNPSDEFMLA